MVRHFLLGIENGILERLPPVQVQDTQGVWRREATYPPTDAQPLRLALAQEALVPGEPGELGLAFRENTEAYASSNTRLDLPEVDLGVPTSLTFTSAPLAEPLHWGGWPTLALRVRADMDDAHLAALLLDVAPDGTATWVNRGYLSLRHRDGVEAPAPVPVGEPLDVVVRFFPGDTVIEEGHRVQLVLAASDGWTMPQGNGVTLTVEQGTLELPRIERDWAAVTLPVAFGPPVTS